MLEVFLSFIKRFQGQYDESEQLLLAQIIDCYNIAGLEGEKKATPFLRFVPGEVDIQDGEKPFTLIKYNLEFDTWQHKIGLGAIWHLVGELYSRICVFQKLRCERLQEKFKKLVYIDTLNDPISVAMEEMKYWLSTELSKTDFSNITACENAKKQVAQRKAYVTKLKALGAITAAETTSQFLEADLTIFQLFIEMENIFENFFIPTIDLQISRQNSRDHFKTLAHNTEKIIKDGLRFLMLILSDVKIPTQFMMQELRHPQIQASKNFSATSYGTILGQLVRTQFFTDIFPDTHPLESTHQLITFEQEFTIENLLTICPNISTEGQAWWEKDNSGIMKEFRKEPIITAFVRAHFLLVLQTQYYHFFQLAFDLAGEGGDLTIYGIAASTVRQKISEHAHLLLNLDNTLKILYKEAKNIETRIFYKDKVADAPDWKQNYFAASSSYEELTNTIKSSYSALTQLETGLNALTLNQRIARIKTKLAEFTDLAKQISVYQVQLLPAASAVNTPITSVANSQQLDTLVDSLSIGQLARISNTHSLNNK